MLDSNEINFQSDFKPINFRFYIPVNKNLGQINIIPKDYYYH